MQVAPAQGWPLQPLANGLHGSIAQAQHQQHPPANQQLDPVSVLPPPPLVSPAQYQQQQHQEQPQHQPDSPILLPRELEVLLAAFKQGAHTFRAEGLKTLDLARCGAAAGCWWLRCACRSGLLAA